MAFYHVQIKIKQAQICLYLNQLTPTDPHLVQKLSLAASQLLSLGGHSCQRRNLKNLSGDGELKGLIRRRELIRKPVPNPSRHHQTQINPSESKGMGKRLVQERVPKLDRCRSVFDDPRTCSQLLLRSLKFCSKRVGILGWRSG